MRCSIIRRVSTEQQKEKISLSDQLKKCQQTIQERDWQFIEDFNFGARHGSELQNHPIYVALKQHIENDKTDILLSAILGRALRDTGFLDRSLPIVAKTPQTHCHTFRDFRSHEFRT